MEGDPWFTSLPGGSINYQGHLSSQEGHLWQRPRMKPRKSSIRPNQRHRVGVQEGPLRAVIESPRPVLRHQASDRSFLKGPG